jgi:M6 family metalloprotease-like protein/uncharacterized repeat protein (TIGR02543 family)
MLKIIIIVNKVILGFFLLSLFYGCADKEDDKSLGFVKNYTITFNANGGTGFMNSQTKIHGNSITLNDNSFSKTNFSFVEWNSKPYGNGDSYNNKAIYTNNKDITLYAQWQPDTYTITFNGNTNTGGFTANQTKIYNVDIAIANNGFTKTGYKFTSWNTKTNGSGTNYIVGAEYTDNKDITLYAQWQLKNPTTPSQPFLNNNISNEIDISFNNVVNANYYRLYHSNTKNGIYNEIYSGTGLNYTHTGLITESEHYYKLKACLNINENTCSDFSTISSAYAIKIIRLPLLIIAIEFNDKTLTDSVTKWSDKIFGSDEGQLNSYYNEISYGKFQFAKTNETHGTVGDGIIKVKLNKNHPNYKLDNNKQTEMLNDFKEAINQADPFINFAQFDNDNSTGLSKNELQIVFLLAGGESAMGQIPGIWAHAFHYNGNGPQHDGVYLMDAIDDGKYATFGEMHSSSRTANIGVIAHELGHSAFGLPDLYDSDGSSYGIGFFGLMGYGTWGQKEGDAHAGDTPVHMTGWSKAKIGFVTPIEITSNTNLNLKASNLKGPEGYKLYKIKNPIKTNEYFLFENRSNFGYDRGFKGKLDGIYQGGILILHIDDDITDNKDDNHRKVDVEEANNLVLGPPNKISDGHSNNLWFSGNKDLFNNLSSPNSKWYNDTDSGLVMKNISTPDKNMTLDIEF